jgi:hypothetical protein
MQAVLPLLRVSLVPEPNRDALIGAAEDFCLAESSDGYMCTEQPNHDGWHRAVLDGELLNAWPPSLA